MNTKIMVGISAVVSLIYVVADEIAVNYMLAAANGAAMAAPSRPAVDLVTARREAQAAVVVAVSLVVTCLRGGRVAFGAVLCHQITPRQADLSRLSRSKSSSSSSLVARQGLGPSAPLAATPGPEIGRFPSRCRGSSRGRASSTTSSTR